MNQLQIINLNGRLLVDSREVARMVERPHDQLMRSIRTYIEYLTTAEMQTSEFFVETSYGDNKGELRPCFLLTKKGCDMVANKMTGEKGVLFTAAYVTKFEEMEKQIRGVVDVSALSPELQMFKQLFDGVARVQLEQVQTKQLIQSVENRVDTLATGLTAVPDHTKVVQRVNEYARWTRQGHNEVYNKIYSILKAQHGIDVQQRVENERHRINIEHFNATGRYYAESTLKKKVNGIDVMVRMGVLDKFNEILVGLLTQAKGA